MAESFICLGHEERVTMRNKTTKKLLNSQLEAPPDNSRRVLIRKGPVSLETSLKELEENFARKQEKQE